MGENWVAYNHTRQEFVNTGSYCDTMKVGHEDDYDFIVLRWSIRNLFWNSEEAVEWTHYHLMLAGLPSCDVSEYADVTPAYIDWWKQLTIRELEEKMKFSQEEQDRLDDNPGAEILHQIAQEANVSEELFIVAGTGSRSLQNATPAEKQAVFAYLVLQLTALKEKYGDNLRVMSGLAEGFDKALMVAAISLDIKVIAAIPNKGYGKYYWGRKSLTGTNRLEEFNSLLEQADEVVYVAEDVYDTRDIYIKIDGKKVHSNFVRNEYMVEQANAFYVYDPSSSGTKHAFKLIRDARKPYKLVPVS